MDRNRSIGYGLALAAGFELLAFTGTVISPGPLLTGDAIVPLVLGVTFAIAGASFLSEEGSTVDGPWSWRIMAVLTGFVIVNSGLSAFFTLA
jgi:hypothetical protein